MYVANDQKDDGSQKAFPVYDAGYDKSWYFGSWQYGASVSTLRFIAERSVPCGGATSPVMTNSPRCNASRRRLT